MGQTFSALSLWSACRVTYLHTIKLQYKPALHQYNYVTRPVKTEHIDTNYTLKHNRSFLSIGTEYLYSVTCITLNVKYSWEIS